MSNRTWKERAEDALKYFRGVIDYADECPEDARLNFREIIKASITPYHQEKIERLPDLKLLGAQVPTDDEPVDPEPVAEETTTDETAPEE